MRITATPSKTLNEIKSQATHQFKVMIDPIYFNSPDSRNIALWLFGLIFN